MAHVLPRGARRRILPTLGLAGTGLVALVLVLLALRPPHQGALSAAAAAGAPGGAPGGTSGGASGGVVIPTATAEPAVPPAAPAANPADVGVRVLNRIPTTDPVVFLGIDDGMIRLPQVAQTIRRLRLPVSLFVLSPLAEEDPAYFRSMVETGATVEDHSITHPLLTRMSQERQEREICGAADTMAGLYGRRPTILRPPYGAYDRATLRAAASCGIHTVVTWNVAVNDGVVQYQKGSSLQPGDIVLMHFRKTGVEDLAALLTAVQQAGLRIASLEEYVARLPAVTTLPTAAPPAARTRGPSLVRRPRRPTPLPSPVLTPPPTPVPTPVPTPLPTPVPTMTASPKPPPTTPPATPPSG